MAVDQRTWKKWQDLEAAGNPGFFLQLLEIFLSEGPKQLAELESALQKGDRHLIRMTSHTLGSTCENLGVMVFKEFRKIEAQCKTPEQFLPKELSKDIRDQFAVAVGLISAEAKRLKKQAA